MLQTSLDQIHYMIEALERTAMRERLERLVILELPILEAGIAAGIKPQAGRALHILISLGRVSRSDFKVFLELGERAAIGQLKKLIELGLVESLTPRSLSRLARLVCPIAAPGSA